MNVINANISINVLKFLPIFRKHRTVRRLDVDINDTKTRNSDNVFNPINKFKDEHMDYEKIQ